MKKIKCWWPVNPKPGNLGDIITPIILKTLFNVKAEWVDYKQYKDKFLLSTGSILKRANKFTTVWGSGAMRNNNDKYSSNANYLAVRGPISYELLKSFNTNIKPIFGDPALLLPEFFNPSIPKKYKLGIIPHYVDFKKIKKWYKYSTNEIKIINVLNSNPLICVKEIMECEKIISSSLHGIIIPHAYNIPTCWAKISEKLAGDGTKFLDYYESVKLNPQMIDFTSKIKVDNLYKLPFKNGINIDTHPLQKVFYDFIQKY